MMEVYPFEENRRLFLAFAFSALLHLILVISLELRPNFSWRRHKKEPAKAEDIIRFDFVQPEPPLVMDTPEVDKEEVPTKPTNIMSDKDVAAKDMLDKDKDINDSPYAEGKTKIKEVRKSIPSPASIPQREMKPQPEVKQSQSVPDPPVVKGEEKAGIKMVPIEETLPQQVPPQEQVPPQKEQVASLPKDVLHVPLYDGRSSNAQSFGEVTFNAKKHDVAPYIIEMKKRIEGHWAPPVVFTYYGLTSGETVVQFKIMPDGSVKDVNVIKEKGDESLKKSSVRAIMDASPFDPIPPNVLAGEEEKYLGITFTFYYIIDEPVKRADENI